METSTSKQFIPLLESIPYPSHPVMKWLFKTPLLLWRLGLGPLVGRFFMIMTTTGRKSGLPRHTAIEFHELEGKPTVMSGWGEKTDWYRNLAANPLATVQTWRGAQFVRARRIDSDEELRRAFAWAQSSPTMQRMMKLAGFAMSAEQFIAEKERFTLVIFEPTDQPTPSPLKADLVWLWAVLLSICFLLVWLTNFRW